MREPDWSLEDLEQLLQQQEWQAADQVTQALLLAAVEGKVHRSLSPQALASISCRRLHDINHLWVTASHGQFGFSVQHRLYTELAKTFDITELNLITPHPFCQQVGWLMVTVPRPLAFFKFYDFLDFSLGAPQGHLPAYWYWRLSWLESWRTGGFGSGRGAGFADLARLDAMMLRWTRCSQV
ncbi:MAG: hypothetical protein HC922_05265 [Leptolyngbyaceae cyanobacterium SM2_3_12]|nr:hypothetical protein [Leptolyngbyaceae cyanobacterium SM2_3_12]